MKLSIEEMQLIVSALGTLDAEYGTAGAVELADRVREAMQQLEAESPSVCGFELPDGSTARMHGS